MGFTVEAPRKKRKKDRDHHGQPQHKNKNEDKEERREYMGVERGLSGRGLVAC